MTSIKELKSDKLKFKNEPVKYVEITNLLGHKYRELCHFDEAVEEHNEAIVVSKKLKNLTVAREYEAISRRALGECFSEMGKHVEAKAQHDLYLNLSLGMSDPIEIQRAHATIGRTYLLWAQDTDMNRTQRSLLFKSAASFKKALELCESLMSSGKLKSREYADMKSRLLLNLGLVYENLNDFDKCKKLLLDSIELTKSNFLYDELFRCQISLGSIYEKINLLNEALQSYEDALQTANLLKSKTKKCDALLCLGIVMMKQGNVEKSRNYFKKAFLLKSLIEEDKQKAERLLKIASVIRDDVQKLLKCVEGSNEIITLCDLIGDHFVEMKCYSQAIKYYKQELHQAKKANKPNSVLAKIYVSIGQTYSDEHNYEEAIECFTQEYNLNLANKCEQCGSLLKIADLQESLYGTIDELELEEKANLKTRIIATYCKALRLFDSDSLIHKENDRSVANGSIESINRKEMKWHVQAIKAFLHFLEIHKLDIDQQKELKIKLSNLNDSDDDDNDDAVEVMEDNDDHYDNYNLDLLSSGSENSANSENEEIPDNFRSRHKRNPNASKLNRLNQFGETPLHTACIAGNILQVERLIEQKASLNAKDFCGWTPLHEACNHGYLEIVECLLKHGANIEVYDDRSERITPLHDACNCGHFLIIQLLLRYGANVLVVNAKNETPVECLMSWRKRSENELNNDDMDQCITLEKEMLAAMKDKGFDLNNLHDKMKGNLNSQSTKRDIPLVNRQRNLLGRDIYLERNDLDRPQQKATKKDKRVDYDDPGTAREEYASTISKLRRTHLASRFAKLDSRERSQQEALIKEDEVAPRDDWLVDDMVPEGKKVKRRSKDDYCEPNRKKIKPNSQPERTSQRQSIGLDFSSDDVDHSDNLQADSSDLGNDFNIQPTLLTTTIEPVIDDWHCEFTNKKPTISGQIPSTILTKSSLTHNLKSKEYHAENNAIKMAIVQFDDLEKSSFAIPVNQIGLTFRKLSERVIERYFRKFAMKPMISLYSIEGAILSEDDIVSDFIMEKQLFKAKIESWTIEPAQDIYVELCQESEVKPYQGLIDVFGSLRIGGTFNISNAFISSSKQATAMFQSLFRQDIKEMNLSCTSIMSNKANIDCFFNMLSTLPTLQVLNLSCTAFPKKYLINLLNLSPVLRQLDLSFNSIGDEHAYTLFQIINMYDKLRYLNLTGCDFTRNLIQHKLLINAIEGSNLISLQLDFNQIDQSLVTKFKSLNSDKSFLKDLLVGR